MFLKYLTVSLTIISNRTVDIDRALRKKSKTFKALSIYNTFHKIMQAVSLEKSNIPREKQHPLRKALQMAAMLQ